MLFNLPNEIINIILSYVERPKHAKIIKYLIEECYEEDYDPFWSETWRDNYSFEYYFYEWYYLYRYQFKLGGVRNNKKNIYKYKYTPNNLLIGNDRLFN
jgi:hypothetical protein